MMVANIGFSVVALIAGIILYLSKIWPKAQIVLMLLAGAGMSAGVIGGGIYDGVAGAIAWVSGATTWGFGAPVPGLLAIVAAIIITVGWMGKVGWMRGHQRHVVPAVALLAPVTWYLTGGIFGPLAVIIGSIGSALGGIFFGSMGLS